MFFYATLSKDMQYVALLRGINVGGNRKVPMATLKHVFETLGAKNVRTYINSGNVLFEAPKTLLPRIQPALKKAFGFEIPTLTRDAKNIQALCKKLPANYTNDTEQRTEILFLWDAYDKKASLKLAPIKEGIDHLTYIPGTLVWNFKRAHATKSGMHEFIGTELYKHMTARNINTVRKLNAMMND